MANEEVAIIRIIPEGASGGTLGGGAGGSKTAGGTGMGAGAFKGIGDAMGGAMKAIGIGSLVGLLVMIVGSFKALMGMIGGIIKLVSFLLKPIADVITVLLMPILFILKPFVILLNQVMAPFLKLGMQLMQQGGQQMGAGDMTGAMASFASAGAVLMLGLDSVLIALSTSLLKMLTTILFDIGAGLIAIITPFSFEQVQNFVSVAKDSVLKGIDLVGGTASIGLAAMASAIGEQAGIDTEAFRVATATNIAGLFSADEESGLTKIMENALGVTFKDGTVTAIEGAMTGEGGITPEFENKMGEFQDKGVSAVQRAVDAIQSTWDSLNLSKKSSGSSGGGGGFWSSIGSLVKDDNYIEGQY
jgi:hypothetical protein